MSVLILTFTISSSYMDVVAPIRRVCLYCSSQKWGIGF